MCTSFYSSRVILQMGQFKRNHSISRGSGVNLKKRKIIILGGDIRLDYRVLMCGVGIQWRDHSPSTGNAW